MQNMQLELTPVNRSYLHVLEYLRGHRVVSIVAGHMVVALALGAILLSNTFGSTILSVFAETACSSGDQTYAVVGGDTLGAIAARYGTTWQSLASYNKIVDANFIYINEHVCIPGHGQGNSGGYTNPAAAKGWSNPYAYPQCTYWANQRFYQMHGFFVPWSTNADAWEWTARAYDYGWHVSSSPSVGAIVDLQPWVQGAYGLGHVALVEQVLGNGDVIASNMNWGGYPYNVTNVEFSPGAGVTFISY